MPINTVIAKKLEWYKTHPVEWCKDFLGTELWWKQESIARSLIDYQEVDVVSAHGTGKSWLCARLALWWLFTRKDSIVLTTAPTDRQLATVLWGDIRAGYKQSKVPLGGELLPADTLLRCSEKHYLRGLVSSKDASLTGYHAPGGTLLILDEAAGIDERCWPPLESNLTNSNDRICRIGNPLCPPSHPFAKSCARGEIKGKHITFHISAFDTPNVIYKHEIIPGLITLETVNRFKERYGEASAIYRSRILGKFAESNPDSLIPLEMMEVLWSRGYTPQEKDERVMGVDIARQGNDSTVITIRIGSKIIIPSNGILEKATGTEVARRVADLAKDYKVTKIYLDGGGLGAGPIDILDDLQARGEFDSSIEIVEVQFGSAATEPQRYINRRCELLWLFREWVRDVGVIECNQETKELIQEEITAPRYGWKGNRIAIEAKEDIKKRLGRSTDYLDSMALAVSGGENDSSYGEVFVL